MKAMHVWMAALLTAASFSARAEGVHSEEQAIRRVSESVARNQLASLKPECLMFMAEKTKQGYTVDVREKHDA